MPSTMNDALPPSQGNCHYDGNVRAQPTTAIFVTAPLRHIRLVTRSRHDTILNHNTNIGPARTGVRRPRLVAFHYGKVMPWTDDHNRWIVDVVLVCMLSRGLLRFECKGISG